MKAREGTCGGKAGAEGKCGGAAYLKSNKGNKYRAKNDDGSRQTRQSAGYDLSITYTGTIWVPLGACPPVPTLAASCQWHPLVKVNHCSITHRGLVLRCWGNTVCGGDRYALCSIARPEKTVLHGLSGSTQSSQPRSGVRT